jgi:hypothetical protein
LLQSAAAGPLQAETGAYESLLILQLTELWKRSLGIAPFLPDDVFFENGGDSLLATEMQVELLRRPSVPLRHNNRLRRNVRTEFHEQRNRY